MQRFKKELHVSGRWNSVVCAYMSAHGKFVYDAPGSMCQYARWRNEQIRYLGFAALYRDSAKRYPYFRSAARMELKRVFKLHANATLVFARLSDA